MVLVASAVTLLVGLQMRVGGGGQEVAAGAGQRGDRAVGGAPRSGSAGAPAGAPGRGGAAAAVGGGTGTSLVSYGFTRHPSAPVLLVIGASYTAGLGASPVTDGYAYQAADLLGWRAEIDGAPGTGYLNPGPHGAGAYQTRLAALAVPVAPQVVLVQSGRNDLAWAADTVQSAAVATLRRIRARWPQTRIVVLGAIPAAAAVPAALARLQAAFAAAAQAAGSVFIDPIAEHWITASNQASVAGPVPAHPGNDGYRYLAHRLVDDLRALPSADMASSPATTPARP